MRETRNIQFSIYLDFGISGVSIATQPAPNEIYLIAIEAKCVLVEWGKSSVLQGHNDDLHGFQL